jgi:hypothetical protein
MTFKQLRGGAIRVIASVAGAGIFYAVWLVGFLTLYSLNHAVLNSPLWLLASVITAAGFAAGAILAERFTEAERSNFWRVYVWPLAGCVVVAVIVHGFGPMPTGFGLFAAGTVSIIVREAISIRAQMTTQHSQ